MILRYWVHSTGSTTGGWLVGEVSRDAKGNEISRDVGGVFQTKREALRFASECNDELLQLKQACRDAKDTKERR